jgi:ABC-2 type transport system permease protein
MLRRTVALTRKELLVMARAPRGLAALVVPALIQLLLFGYAATFDVERAPMAIMNEDQGLQGRELAARFIGSPLFDVTALTTNETDLRSLIDRGQVVVALHIGQTFSAELGRGSAVDVQVIVDGRILSTAQTVQGYAATVIAEFNRDHVIANGLPRPAAFTVTRAWFNPDLLSHWYVIPGLVAKVLLIVVLTSTALSVAHERELGTLERLLAAPLSPLEILAGKAVPAMAIGFAQGLLLTAVTVGWFGVPFRGAGLLLAVALVAMLLATIGIGLMISTIARTPAQAILGTFAFTVPAVMLSGFATPIASMPEVIQLLTFANPLRYFIRILRDLFLRGSGWEIVWPQVWPMLLIGVVTLAVSHRMLRQGLDRSGRAQG